jgi:hypothetical protein
MGAAAKTVDERAFTKLLDYLGRVPAVEPAIGHSGDGIGGWWLELSTDIDHPRGKALQKAVHLAYSVCDSM